MQFIIQGGLDTKWIKKNTLDAVLLALKNKNVEGFMIPIGLTKDNQVVMQALEDTQNYDYQTLQYMNTGSKLAKCHTQPLSCILDECNNMKKMILLDDLDKNNGNIVFKDTIDITKHYQNIPIYLFSHQANDVLSLEKKDSKLECGVCVSPKDIYLMNINCDFYVFDYSVVREKYVMGLIKEGKKVFISEISSKEMLNDLKVRLKEVIDSPLLYFIVDNYSLTQ